METYFVSSNILGFRRLLQSNRSAGLFCEVLYHYRAEQKYLLHEFVVMPDHFHLLITPVETTIERAVQSVKGGFSFRARESFGWKGSLWQRSFHDRRIRDAAEYVTRRGYIWWNPVEAGLCARPEDWPFGSASGKFELDAVPQRLKPPLRQGASHA